MDPFEPQTGYVVIELKCCCCGSVQDTLATRWPAWRVRPESVWTREPCEPCEARLAAEDAELHRGGIG